MDLSGAGAKAVVALALHGPLTLEELLGDSGVSRRALWAGIAQAEKLGVVRRIRRGRTTLYSSPLSPRPESGLSSVESRQSSSSLLSSSNSSDYRDAQGAKTAPQEAKIAPDRSGPEAKIAPHRGLGAKTALQEAKTAPRGDEPEAEIAPSPLDLVLAADRMPTGEVSNQVNSPYVHRRRAQRAALMALWQDLFPGNPIPAASSFDRWLLETGNSAFFVGTVIQDMAATGRVIESPMGYVTKAIQGRVREGRIPHLPIVSETPDLEEMTPELAAQLARADREGQTMWNADDD